MVKPEYIHKIIKDRQYKYWIVYNSQNQAVEAQLKDIDTDSSLAAFLDWYDNILGGSFTIKLYQKNPFTTSGTLKPNVQNLNCEFQVTPTLRERQPLPPLPVDSGMGGMGPSPGGFNPWIDKFLEVKDHIAGLNVQLEQNRMKEDYERRIREMQEEHSKAMEEKTNAWEERIMAIASTVAPDLLKGFMGKPINGIEEEETKQTENMTQAHDAKNRILTAVNKLIEKDPNFTENIEKLAKLVEKNPTTYQQAVKMLNSFV